MTHRWAPDTWVLKVSRAVNLWKTQAQGSASFPASALYIPNCRPHVRHSVSQKVCFVNWRHIHSQKSRVRKRWLCRASQVRQRLGLHTSSLCSNTSASRWSAGLSQHMSRIKNTLDSVSKAVSGSHTELLSKIARLKANATQTGKQIEPSPQPATAEFPNPQAQAIPAAPPATLNPTPIHVVDTATTPSTANSISATVGSRPPAVPNSSASTLHSRPNVAQANAIAPATSTKRLRRVTVAVQTNASVKKEPVKPPPPVSDIKTSTPVPKTATPLFHPSSFSVNLDETYNYLAHHVNTYFGAGAKADEKKSDNSLPSSAQERQTGDIIPMSDKQASKAPNSNIPPSPRKGFGHYLSYSAPTVQAFVGSYITPLVPKFRAAELKGAAAVEERKLLREDTQSVEAPMKMEQTAAEEKAKRLLIQREKIIARVSVDNRTRGLVQALHRASDVRVYINRVEDFSYHLLEFPETRGVAVKEKVIPCLLRLRQAGDPVLKAAVREALTLVGYNNPVKGRGIRVLSIDGGGTRGLIALQTLHKLELLTGKPIYQLFDYICGVSTGAILGFMLGVFQIPLRECEDMYRKLGSDVFKQNVIVGTVKMGWNHAFYDSETWENILKEKMGSELMVETARNPGCPKVAAVSTIVNRGSLKAHVFRNYNLQAGVRSHYLGGCQHKVWQALRASSAAPGYFQEFSLGQDLHQDGGLLMNNPTALAIHECKCLWPNTPVECVVSLGTGRFETPGKNSATYTSLKTKITNVISSATDTEEVHTMLDALLPPDTYFRFNPYMNEDIALDESRHEKFNLLQTEGLRYLERNEEKLQKAASILTRQKSPVQRLSDWAKLRAQMYDGLHSLSKH